jgi:hypothetical protein
MDSRSSEGAHQFPRNEGKSELESPNPEKLGANVGVDKNEVVECEGDQVEQRPLENSTDLAVVKIGEQ